MPLVAGPADPEITVKMPILSANLKLEDSLHSYAEKYYLVCKPVAALNTPTSHL